MKIKNKAPDQWRKTLFVGTVFIILIVTLIATLLVFTSCKSDYQKALEDDNKTAANVPPDFTLDDLNGNTFSLSGLKGQVVVINFWATWCPPCRAEIPDFISVYEEYKTKNVIILGISSESTGEVRSFADEFGINYPVLIDTTGDVFRQWKVDAIPHTFVLDIKGEVILDQLGLMSKDQLISAIEKAIGQ